MLDRKPRVKGRPMAKRRSTVPAPTKEEVRNIEESVDGMPKRPKPREWYAYIRNGKIINSYQVGIEKPCKPCEGDEFVPLIERMP